MKSDLCEYSLDGCQRGGFEVKDPPTLGEQRWGVGSHFVG
jgi:hypothetical protein